MRSSGRYRPIKIGDIAIIIFFLSSLFFLPKVPGEKVEIRVDNSREFIYPLSKDRTLDIKGAIGTTRIVIKDGRVKVTKAPCPLKLCKKMGWISKKGEQIICIPNKVYIRIEGEEYDGVTE
ncbi:MAG: NusG domain II-containing protein [candidate division WOR-3 bacterium]|nr:NusG domain II-containing protein [candidate division WOR-3 bacterium]